MRRYILLFSLAIMFVSCKSSMPLRKVSITFSIDAQEVNLIPVKAPLKRYKLVIKQTSNRVFAFEGFPMKKLRTLTLGQFFLAWNDSRYGFKKTPPRAAVIAYIPHRKGHMERVAVIVKLSNPEYDQKKDELKFDAVALSQPNNWMVGHPVQLADLLIEARLKEVPFEHRKQLE
ncbi:MAG: hypothetical protein P0S95_00080 [Rhabdochlamydiaceae bacterium]|nr:hypothetical protein [Candidatus Amphrikana amoebophyrae]